METYYFTIKGSTEIFQIKATSPTDFKKNYKRVVDGVLADYSTELVDIKNIIAKPKLSKKVQLFIDNMCMKHNFVRETLVSDFDENNNIENSSNLGTNLYCYEQSLPYVFYDNNLDIFGFCSKQSFIHYYKNGSIIDYPKNSPKDFDVELYKFPSGDKVEFEIVNTIRFI